MLVSGVRQSDSVVCVCVCVCVWSAKDGEHLGVGVYSSARVCQVSGCIGVEGVSECGCVCVGSMWVCVFVSGCVPGGGTSSPGCACLPASPQQPQPGPARGPWAPMPLSRPPHLQHHLTSSAACQRCSEHAHAHTQANTRSPEPPRPPPGTLTLPPHPMGRGPWPPPAAAAGVPIGARGWRTM